MRQLLSHRPHHTCGWVPWGTGPLENTSWGLQFGPHRWFFSREFFWGRKNPDTVLPSPQSTPQEGYRIGMAIEASAGQMKWTQLAEMMERFSSRCPNGDGPSIDPRPRGSAQCWRHWQMHYRKLHGHLIS